MSFVERFINVSYLGLRVHYWRFHSVCIQGEQTGPHLFFTNTPVYRTHIHKLYKHKKRGFMQLNALDCTKRTSTKNL